MTLDIKSAKNKKQKKNKKKTCMMTDMYLYILYKKSIEYNIIVLCTARMTHSNYTYVLHDIDNNNQ